MLILLSPAKTLNETWPEYLPPEIEDKISKPQLSSETQQLVEIMKNKSSQDIQTLMHVSEKIGNLNFNRYKSFPQSINNINSFPALHCFEGDVYKNIEHVGDLELIPILFLNTWRIKWRWLITLWRFVPGTSPLLKDTFIVTLSRACAVKLRTNVPTPPMLNRQVYGASIQVTVFGPQAQHSPTSRGRHLNTNNNKNILIEL